MSYEVGYRRGLSMLAVVVAALLGIGCSAGATDPDSEELVGADETVGSMGAGVSGALDVGSELTTTANVNLRGGASTGAKILHVVPSGATVVVTASSPSNGFYQVKHDGTTGWMFGKYLEATSDGGSSSDDGDPPSSSSARDLAIGRAKSTKGFSYWWGHGRFRPEGPTSSTKGSCSGSCPSCSHKGSYGADCSGLVAKVWEVPSSNDDLTVDAHPYSSTSFDGDSSLWHTVSRNKLLAADALVYHSGSAGHVFVYGSGDGWGSIYAYECKGCAYGCVGGYRTASSSYHGIRRAGY